MRRLALAVMLAACGDNAKPIGPDSGGIPDAHPFDAALSALLSLSPLTADFGAVDMPCAAPPQTFTVSNGGNVASSALAVTLLGSGATAFAISADTCSGATLAASATCTFAVGTAQLHAGASSATVQVSGAGTVAAALDVTGLAAEALTSSPSSLAFPSTTVGATSTAMSVTFTNPGGCANLGVLATQLVGIDASSFEVTSDTCAGHELADGTSCTIAIAFAPTAAGSRTATLSVASGVGTLLIPLSGEATPAPAKLQISPALKDFGSANIGCTTLPDTTFTVTNVGGSPSTALATAIDGADKLAFTIDQDTCAGTILAPTGSCTVAVSFHPSGTAGSKSATLTATATGTQAVATLLGTALASGGMILNPVSAQLGDVTVGATSAPKTFTLTSTGGCPGTGKLTVSLTGSDPASFATANDTCSGAVLAGGQSCTVDVVFSPTATGARSANLTFVASPGGVASAALSGSGL